ncbi:hypothetical protein KY284_007848 [Solanum tuberosum]|nr:hypothetical protein KY284_007848 [Solanum tuberosum]
MIKARQYNRMNKYNRPKQAMCNTKGRNRYNKSKQTRLSSKCRTQKSGDQISVSPTPVIVDVEDHCCDNDIPSPANPIVLADEVCGGRLVVKKKHSNLQEGEPKGRALSQVMHENQSTDPKTYL